MLRSVFSRHVRLNLNENGGSNPPPYNVTHSTFIKKSFCILHLIDYRCDISVSGLYFVILEGATRPKDLIP